MTQVPRILVTIPHYRSLTGNTLYGSTFQRTAARLDALRRCITSLHQTFGSQRAQLQFQPLSARPADQRLLAQVDVVLCTVGDAHLVDQLDLPAGMFTQERTGIADPMMLGFECHRVLKERFGQYDWYAYMEDDLIINDSLFLAKYKWFTSKLGADRLLMPNRFEVSTYPGLHKVYIDGAFPEEYWGKVFPRGRQPPLVAKLLDQEFLLEHASNPHSGMFFLSAEQLGMWLARPHYLDRHTGFVGPLESAASHGPMRVFHIYKPHPSNAGFVEVQHAGDHFITSILRAAIDREQGDGASDSAQAPA